MNRYITVIALLAVGSVVGCAGQADQVDEGSNGAAPAGHQPAAVTPAKMPDGPPPSLAAASQVESRSERAISPDVASCWFSGSNWWCNNRYAAPVRASDGTIVGYMYSTTSWFICRAEGGYNGTHVHPNRWEWTEADNGNWGWMGDGDISNETDSLPVCNFSP